MSWISVKDNLPETYPVMVINPSCVNGDGEVIDLWMTHHIKKKGKEFYAYNYNFQTVHNISHWMKPPRVIKDSDRHEPVREQKTGTV